MFVPWKHINPVVKALSQYNCRDATNFFMVTREWKGKGDTQGAQLGLLFISFDKNTISCTEI